MKRYKLLKDLPTFKAGQLAYISKTGNLIAGTPENQKTTETGLIIMIYHETTLKKFPNILTEWFEEIKEPVDSIHWEPKIGDKYWTSSGTGVYFQVWRDDEFDRDRYELGRVYKTKEECEKAYKRELAEARLRRTSTFTPDWEDGLQIKYVVIFNHVMNRLEVHELTFEDLGLPVYFESEVSAMKSIRENKQDWKIYFGIKEEK